jgi:deazaflavin-dependent oxidoreductase (nitroreductase family)
MFARGRPNLVARVSNAVTAALAGAGLSPKRLVVLEVRGRLSGRTRTLPIVVADYGGDRYLVSMLGPDQEWVRNVRAAGGRALLRHRRREAVRLEEVAPASRAPILRRYLEVAPGARAHISLSTDAPLSEFERIADRHVVFRVAEPVEPPLTQRDARPFE